ncbi:MAG: Sua5/YciO/YrdC/YwlC family protein, partial [Chromatiaceae bacterium]|nr:Sua5/YciO/YrdC/YwlC family protein [Chromatiaceae bacterium]
MTPTLDGARALGAGLGQRLRLAAHWIKAGGVVAYPTEAVYGLGCDPWNGEATRRILTLKQRPESKGLILIAAAIQQLTPFVELLEAERMEAILASWPGPHTWLLPARPEVPSWLRGEHATLAVRVTAHPLAAAL